MAEHGESAIRASRMRPGLGLRTHLFILLALVLVSSLTSGLIFWLRDEADEKVESSFHQDLNLLALLPRLRADIRQVDLMTEVGSKTGDPEWRAMRARSIQRVESLFEKLNAEPHSAQIQSLIAEFKKNWTLFVEARSAIAANEFRRDLDEFMTAISYTAVTELEDSKASLENSSLRRFLARTAVELAGALIIAFYLYYFIVTPVIEIEKAARQWQVGASWPLQISHAIPEIGSLVESFSENTRKLNAQFDREKELNAFKTRLVSLVSHEFGNALAVIKNAAYLLEDKASAQDLKDKGQFYRMIESNTDMLSDAVNNLLSMSRVEAGKLAVNFAETRVEEILRKTVERLGLLADIKRLDIKLDIPQNLASVRADASALSLVVSNLLSNAIKYTQEGGRITAGVALEPGKPGFCRVYVSDTGIGIGREDKDRILHGYYRTESGRRLSSRGFGIGLSLARQIIEAHGSELDMESAPGKGSRFSFLLPLWG